MRRGTRRVQEPQSFDVQIQRARDEQNNKLLEPVKLVHGADLGSEDILHTVNAQTVGVSRNTYPETSTATSRPRSCRPAHRNIRERRNDLLRLVVVDFHVPSPLNQPCQSCVQVSGVSSERTVSSSSSWSKMQMLKFTVEETMMSISDMTHVNKKCQA